MADAAIPNFVPLPDLDYAQLTEQLTQLTEQLIQPQRTLRVTSQPDTEILRTAFAVAFAGAREPTATLRRLFEEVSCVLAQHAVKGGSLVVNRGGALTRQ